MAALAVTSPYSITTSKFLAPPSAPGCTSSFTTFPLTGAFTVVCIFIASITSRRSPLETIWLTSTDTLDTAPGIGAPTCPGCAGIGFGPLFRLHFQRLSTADRYLSRLTVQLK